MESNEVVVEVILEVLEVGGPSSLEFKTLTLLMQGLDT